MEQWVLTVNLWNKRYGSTFIVSPRSEIICNLFPILTAFHSVLNVKSVTWTFLSFCSTLLPISAAWCMFTVLFATCSVTIFFNLVSSENGLCLVINSTKILISLLSLSTLDTPSLLCGSLEIDSTQANSAFSGWFQLVLASRTGKHFFELCQNQSLC